MVYLAGMLTSTSRTVGGGRRPHCGGRRRANVPRRVEMHERFAREGDGSRRVLRAWIEEREVVAGYLKVEERF